MNKTEDTREKIAEFLSSDWPDGWENMPGKIKEVFYDEAEGVLKICDKSGLKFVDRDLEDDLGMIEDIDV